MEKGPHTCSNCRTSFQSIQSLVIDDMVAKFTDEQYATINQSTAGRFDPRVFVNCLQLLTCKQLTKTLGSNVLQLID